MVCGGQHITSIQLTALSAPLRSTPEHTDIQSHWTKDAQVNVWILMQCYSHWVFQVQGDPLYANCPFEPNPFDREGNTYAVKPTSDMWPMAEAVHSGRYVLFHQHLAPSKLIKY